MNWTSEIIAGLASGAGTVFLSGLSALIAVIQKRTKRNKYNTARLMTTIKKDIDEEKNKEFEDFKKKIIDNLDQIIRESKTNLIN